MNSIRGLVDSLTDYDYHLVHLLDENPAYQELALKGNREREIILDNSIFELEEPYPTDKYLAWIEELRPTYAVAPDCLDDMSETLSRLDSFFSENPPKDVKYMAVLQGKTNMELLECWQHLNNYSDVDLIGVSFNSMSFLPEVDPTHSFNKDLAFAKGRINFLDFITKTGSVVPPKPFHLLGVALPQEMRHYKDFYKKGIIQSVDTSSPVVHGYHRIKYETHGLDSKHPQKLHELIDFSVDRSQRIAIAHNICVFRGLARR